MMVMSNHPNLGVRGNYKLVKLTMNNTVQDVEGYVLSLSKPYEDGRKIWFDVKVNNSLSGWIERIYKDDEGDLYDVNYVTFTSMKTSGKLREDELKVFGCMHFLRKMKFDNNFDELTILCAKFDQRSMVVDSSYSMLFKRLRPEMPPYETSDLLGP